MRTKFTEDIKPEKKFLFEKRYCGKCKTGYWLESVPYVEGNYVCPVCGRRIWLYKENAIEHR